MLLFEVALLHFIIPLLLPLLPLLPVVAVDVAVLAHPVRIKLLMRTVPRLFVSSIFVVTVATHALCIVLFFRMSTIINFLSKSFKTYIFFLEDFRSF